MRIDLFDMDEFVKINHLKEVTSPVLFERGGIPNPNGLISNEIFGVSVKSRKETFAYIDLHGHFFHPHIYKIMKRVFRNIDQIVDGSQTFSIQDGKLVKDPNGDTGINWIYNNWSKIKWEGNGGMSSERCDLIGKTKKNEVFLTKEIVIPAFYRDIKTSKGGGGESTELNNLYTRLIRMGAMLENADMFDFSFHSTNATIQNTLVEIYDFFKNSLDKKNGMLRKYLLGKNVDYCVRTVISAPTYNCENPKDNIVDFKHAALPLSQVIVEAYPFIVAWVRNFIEREILEVQNSKEGLSGGNYTLKNPESYFNDEYIRKRLGQFTKDPSSRYDLVTVPLTNGKELPLQFKGMMVGVSADKASIARPLTWCDVLYMAAVECTQDKYCMITRYPVLNNFGFFIAKINVSSTLHTIPVKVNDTIYKWYPDIDVDMPRSQVANNFIDTTRFSDSYLKGLDGDYDGDQVTSKIFWTQEANAECERVINSKSFALNPNGSNCRIIDLEAIQTFYVLTKDAPKVS